MKSEALRQKLRHDLLRARTETDRLFEILAPEAIHERPIPERHRIIFYLGHLEAFDWNMICSRSFGLASLNPQFDHLFEFGIDPVDGALPQDRPSDWPSVKEILAYRDQVRATVDGLLEKTTFSNSAQPFTENGQIFHVAIEHRFMHAETMAYMWHWLDYGLKKNPGGQAAGKNGSNGRSRPRPQLVQIPAGLAHLGQQLNADSFGWDNEFGPHSVDVPEFSIDAFNVSNGDFLEFVRADAYRDRSLWSDDDWAWMQNSAVRHPKFWVLRGDAWYYRTMFEEIPLPLDWPVYVSHAEASAYARWKGNALPSEAQYHRAAYGSANGAVQRQPHGNFDFKRWSPEPIWPNPERAGTFPVYDLIGNGWEWTSTSFEAFAGFEPFPFYPGYSANFFDGKHFVLKGASPRTAAALVRSSFRNWFQAHYPNIYATFRCVQSS